MRDCGGFSTQVLTNKHKSLSMVEAGRVESQGDHLLLCRRSEKNPRPSSRKLSPPANPIMTPSRETPSRTSPSAPHSPHRLRTDATDDGLLEAKDQRKSPVTTLPARVRRLEALLGWSKSLRERGSTAAYDAGAGLAPTNVPRHCGRNTSSWPRGVVRKRQGLRPRWEG